jgi:hypothetical protein
MMSEKRTVIAIDKAWKLLFERHNIAAKVACNGYFQIKASEINTVKEARLMAKFDESVQLPDIFKINNLSILPISRREYIIGPFQTHEKIIYPKCKPTPVAIPDLATIDHTNLYSEASALLFAYNSGIIQDMLNSSDIHYTVNCRMSSGSFEYLINNKGDLPKSQKIIVQNTQIEIDAGYEFNNGFCIVEAKNVAVEEMLVRQLYYPYRLWKSKITKPVIPVFMVFSNDVFHLFQYTFEDINCYNSIKLISYNAYTFANETISLSEITEIWKSIKICNEPEVTFPQADTFMRIIDLLSILFEHGLTRDEVTMKYEFDPRQTSYYIAACDYLNFIERSKNINGETEYQLSIETRNIMTLSYKQKKLALVKRILERPVFNKAFGYIIQNNKIPNKKEVCDIMQSANLAISKTTIGRRSSTVISWIDWILRLANIVEL